MLRNCWQSSFPMFKPLCQRVSTQIVEMQPLFAKSSRRYAKTSGTSRQVRVMNKLFGNRVSGSKKSWYPSATEESGSAFKAIQLGQTNTDNGKSSSRRSVVLNKMFMTQISDLLASGEVSETLLGKGLQIQRVKCCPDFASINIYWLCSVSNPLFEQELQNELKHSSGLLRHLLSQLGLMGQVPRINFVRDKALASLKQLDTLLQNVDLKHHEAHDGETERVQRRYQQLSTATLAKEEFYGQFNDSPPAVRMADLDNEARIWRAPHVRQDVLGLDYNDVIYRIHAKMRKSKQAWDAHHKTTIPVTCTVFEESRKTHSLPDHLINSLNQQTQGRTR